MISVPGSFIAVPGTRNAEKPRQMGVVPGVPGVPGLCARVRVHACSRALSINILPRVHTRNTRNTRNKPCSTTVSSVPGTRNTKTIPGTDMSKPLRAAMPIVTAFIDDFRAEFGEPVVMAIKAGMNGQRTFWARENGNEVGTRIAAPKKTALGASCARCAHWARPGLSAGYCGAGRSDLATSYGAGHPLRKLPSDKGANCAEFKEQ